MDELTALMQYEGDYRRTNLLCVTETWLTEEKDIGIEGYQTVRFDREKAETEKGVGGGLAMFIMKDWCTNFTVREKISTKSYEIFTVSLCPHYLPREFTQLTVILAYVPGPNNAEAADCIAESRP